MYNFPLSGNLPLNNKNDIIKATVRECMNILNDADITVKRSEIKKLDTIDVSIYAQGNDNGNSAALPKMERTETEAAIVNSQWYCIIPPLTTGVLRMNVARYLKYSVTSIDLDNRSYNVYIEDYGFEEGVWMLNSITDAEIYFKNDTISHAIKFTSFGKLLEFIFIDKAIKEFVVPDKQMEKDLKETVIPTLKGIENEDDGADVINHFITAITRVNIELMTGKKPKAVRDNKSTHVKAAAGEIEKTPKPHIVRTLASGVNIKSEKVPKAPTIDTIRHYKIAAWNTRGHIRHYKNGKIAYIKPSIKERKCLKEKGNAIIPQTIVIAG